MLFLDQSQCKSVTVMTTFCAGKSVVDCLILIPELLFATVTEITRKQQHQQNYFYCSNDFNPATRDRLDLNSQIKLHFRKKLAIKIVLYMVLMTITLHSSCCIYRNTIFRWRYCEENWCLSRFKDKEFLAPQMLLFKDFLLLEYKLYGIFFIHK